MLHAARRPARGARARRRAPRVSGPRAALPAAACHGQSTAAAMAHLLAARLCRRCATTAASNLPSPSAAVPALCPGSVVARAGGPCPEVRASGRWALAPAAGLHTLRACRPRTTFAYPSAPVASQHYRSFFSSSNSGGGDGQGPDDTARFGEQREKLEAVAADSVGWWLRMRNRVFLAYLIRANEHFDVDEFVEVCMRIAIPCRCRVCHAHDVNHAKAMCKQRCACLNSQRKRDRNLMPARTGCGPRV